MYIVCMCVSIRINSGRDAAFLGKCLCVCCIKFEGNGTIVGKI